MSSMRLQTWWQTHLSQQTLVPTSSTIGCLRQLAFICVESLPKVGSLSVSLNVTLRTFKMFSNRQACRRMECRLCVRDKSIYAALDRLSGGAPTERCGDSTSSIPRRVLGFVDRRVIVI